MQCKTCKWGQTGRDWTNCKKKCSFKYKQQSDRVNYLRNKLHDFETNVYITPDEYRAICMFIKYIEDNK